MGSGSRCQCDRTVAQTPGDRDCQLQPKSSLSLRSDRSGASHSSRRSHVQQWVRIDNTSAFPERTGMCHGENTRRPRPEHHLLVDTFGNGNSQSCGIARSIRTAPRHTCSHPLSSLHCSSRKYHCAAFAHEEVFSSPASPVLRGKSPNVRSQETSRDVQLCLVGGKSCGLSKVPVVTPMISLESVNSKVSGEPQ